VDRGLLPGASGSAEGREDIGRGNGLVEASLDDRSRLFRPDEAEDEDRRLDSSLAEGEALLGEGDAKPVGPRGERLTRDGDRAVAAGVRLNDRHQAAGGPIRSRIARTLCAIASRFTIARVERSAFTTVPLSSTRKL